MDPGPEGVEPRRVPDDGLQRCVPVVVAADQRAFVDRGQCPLECLDARGDGCGAGQAGLDVLHLGLPVAEAVVEVHAHQVDGRLGVPVHVGIPVTDYSRVLVNALGERPQLGKAIERQGAEYTEPDLRATLHEASERCDQRLDVLLVGPRARGDGDHVGIARVIPRLEARGLRRRQEARAGPYPVRWNAGVDEYPAERARRDNCEVGALDECLHARRVAIHRADVAVAELIRLQAHRMWAIEDEVVAVEADLRSLGP